MNSLIKLFLSGSAVLLFLFSCSFDTQNTSSKGIILQGNGTPLPGAVIKIQKDSSTSVSTFSDSEGHFQVSSLPDTLLSVRVYKTGYDTAFIQPAELVQNQPLTITLNSRPEYLTDQVSSAEYLSLLEEGEIKKSFLLDCSGCHQFDKKLITFEGKLKSKELWKTRTEQMLSFAGAHTGFPIMSPSRDAGKTAEWLTEQLGDKKDPLPSPEMTEIQETAFAAGITVTEYNVPVAFDLPHDLMLDHDGKVIITGMMSGQMYKLNPETGEFKIVEIPTPMSTPRALDIAKDGSWWILLGAPKQMAHYNPSSGEWETYNIGMYPHSIVLDETNSRVWFNGHFSKEPELIGYLDILTGEVTTYEVPVSPMPDGGSNIPYGLRMGPNGLLWATQLVGNRLIKFNPDIEAFDIYSMPTSLSGPRRPDIAADGSVWIPEYTTNRLTHFDPETESFREFELPIKDSLPYVVRVDNRRNAVWIGTGAADAVFRFDIETEQFKVIPLPTRSALIRHMDLDEESGTLWVAYGNSPATNPKIARIEIE